MRSIPAPTDEAVRKLIDKTAQFVATRGESFEKTLLNDQTHSAKYRFLLPTHEYRPFYDKLVRQHKGEDEEEEDDEAEDGGKLPPGIVFPPPDVRALVDKTAKFIAEAGSVMEQRLMTQQRSNLKFAFLHLDNPYRTYYDYAVAEFAAGRTPKAPKAPVPKPTREEAAAEKQKKKQAEAEQDAADPNAAAARARATISSGATVRSAVARAAKAAPRAPPPAFQFAAQPPATISARDHDILLLTAQHTAAGGRQFLGAVTAREASNPDFGFLRATHAYFTYFTALVAHYTLCLKQEEALRAYVADAAGEGEPGAMLRRCVHRLGHERREAAAREAKEAEEEAKRVVYRTTDWNDFILVDTISFDGDDAALPVAERLASAVPTASSVPLPAGDAAATAGGGGGGGDDGDDDMEMDMEEDDGEPLNVITDYKPSVGAAAPAVPRTFRDATGRHIPIEHASEHMRVEMLDPQWQRATQTFIDRQRESSHVTSGDMAANLARLSRMRQRQAGEGADDAAGNPAKRARPAPVQWDGNMVSVEETHRMAADPAVEAARRAEAEAERRRVAAQQVGPQFPQQQQQQPPQQPHPPQQQPQQQFQPPQPQFQPPQPQFQPPQQQFQPPQPQFQPPQPQFQPPQPQFQPPQPQFQPPQPQFQPPPPPAGGPPSGVAAAGGGGAAAALVPEGEWLARHPGEVTVRVQCPEHEAFGMTGQTVEVEVAVAAPTRNIKAALETKLPGMVRSKVQLRRPDLNVFLKDANTVAHYNIGPQTLLELRIKTRGGRK